MDCRLRQCLALLAASKLPFNFAFSPAMNGRFSCSIFLPAIGIVKSVNSSHSDRCVIISYCWFNLHFPTDKWCWRSFHILICYIYILWWAVCWDLLPIFFIEVLGFVVKFQMTFVYFGYSSLPNIWFANIFSICLSQSNYFW